MSWATDENSQVAKLLGYSKCCRRDGCTTFYGLRSWPFYDGLPDFSINAEAQLEILDWFRAQTIRGTLAIRLECKAVSIGQAHYFVKGTNLQDAIWKFVTWILQHERALLDTPDVFRRTT